MRRNLRIPTLVRVCAFCGRPWGLFKQARCECGSSVYIVTNDDPAGKQASDG